MSDLTRVRIELNKKLMVLDSFNDFLFYDDFSKWYDDQISKYLDLQNARLFFKYPLIHKKQNYNMFSNPFLYDYNDLETLKDLHLDYYLLMCKTSSMKKYLNSIFNNGENFQMYDFEDILVFTVVKKINDFIIPCFLFNFQNETMDVKSLVPKSHQFGLGLFDCLLEATSILNPKKAFFDSNIQIVLNIFGTDLKTNETRFYFNQEIPEFFETDQSIGLIVDDLFSFDLPEYAIFNGPQETSNFSVIKEKATNYKIDDIFKIYLSAYDGSLIGDFNWPLFSGRLFFTGSNNQMTSLENVTLGDKDNEAILDLTDCENLILLKNININGEIILKKDREDVIFTSVYATKGIKIIKD